MSRRHKDFNAKTRIEDFEPLSFSLNDEEFECKRAIQGGYLLKFVANADSDSGGRASEAMFGFFKNCMEEDQYERFSKMLDSPDVLVPIDTIGEIVSWLVEEYTARPTEQPQPSSSGGKRSGTT